MTSAFHIPRSVVFFNREGLDVIPYPTDYKTSRHLPLNAFSFTPSADAVYHTCLAMKRIWGCWRKSLSGSER